MSNEIIEKNGRIFFDIADLPDPKTASVEHLTSIIKSYDEKSAPTKEFTRKRNDAIYDLKKLCKDVYNNFTNIYVFGSSINGFGTNSSDVDCFILSKFNLDNKNAYFNPLLKSFRNQRNGFEIIQFARNAYAPVITVKHKTTQIEVDISFASDSNYRMDVLENSGLLNTYAMQNTKIPAVGRFLKFVLLNEPKFGSAKFGGLSSYSHIIMLIYYLLHSQHKLKHIEVKTPYKQLESDLEASEGEIFLGFLKFYACEFDSSKYCIDIRPSYIHETKRKNRFLSIEDPIIDKNLGKSLAPSSVYTLKLFYYKLYCCLVTHNMDEDMLINWIKIDFKCMLDLPHPQINPLCEPEYKQPKKDKTSMVSKKKDSVNSGNPGNSGNIEPTTESHLNASTDKKSSKWKKNKNKPKVSKTVISNNKYVNTDSILHEPTQKMFTESTEKQKVIRPDNLFLSSEDENFILEEHINEIKMPDDTNVQLPKERKLPKWKLIQNELYKVTSALVAQSGKLTIPEGSAVTDYYSTNVVGDSRFFVVVPVLTALGFKVPAIQVQDTETIQKLRCIPGFNPNLKVSEMNHILADVGCFIGFSKELNVTESKLADIMESIGETISDKKLCLGRLLAQKIACGVTSILVDLKCDDQQNKYQAVLKETNDIVALTKDLGITSRVQISDAAIPYGDKLGYTLELQGVLDILHGDGSTEVMDIIAQQCAHILQMNGKVGTLREGEKKVFEVLADGSALDKFLSMLSAQGVSDDTVDHFKSNQYFKVFSPATHTNKLVSAIPGIVRDIKFNVIERVIRKLGGCADSERFEPNVGLDLHVTVGCRINAEACWVTVHHNDKLSDNIRKELNKALVIEKVDFNRIIRTVRSDPDNKNEKKKNKRRNRKSTSKSVPDKEDEKEAGKPETGVSPANSAESVPKDYVVVVNSEEEDTNTRRVTKTSTSEEA